MVKLVEASRMRDVGEDDRRAIDKAAGCDGTRQRILDRRMRRAGAHAVLLHLRH